MVFIRPVKSQEMNHIVIKPDGSISPSTNPIQQNENIYTLTGNIYGSIEVQKSNVVIDGANYTLQGNGQLGYYGVDLVSSVPPITQNVIVKNLRIIDFQTAGIMTVGNCSHIIYGNYLENAPIKVIGCINSWGSNVIQFNTRKDTMISIHYGSSTNTVTNNNMYNAGIVVESAQAVVDRNYWADYLTKYPNAKQVASLGIWDTPYVNGSTDYHPSI